MILYSNISISVAYLMANESGPLNAKKGADRRRSAPLPVSVNAMYYQPVFCVRFGFFMISACGIGKKYILSSHWRETFLRV